MSMKEVSVNERLKLTEKNLPRRFRVKLLGRRESRGLWGIKNTRQPVDDLVKYAKSENLSLPIVDLSVTKEGIVIKPIHSQAIIDHNANEISKTEELLTDLTLMRKLKKEKTGHFGEIFLGIDAISYGVQDMIFTRVFSMIVVNDELGLNPFYCYAFVCEDKSVARDMTYALAAAFQIYSRTIKDVRYLKQVWQNEPVRAPRILKLDWQTSEDKITSQGKCSLDSEA